MKKTIALLSLASVAFLSSCAMDPGYRAYKQEQKAKAQSLVNNPYGAPQSPTDGANPFAVPQGGAPMQPLPPIPGGNPSPVVGGPMMNIPANGQVAPFTGAMITHVVVAGDTIWGLAKKYGVSQYEILSANNLSSNTIQIGQKVLIPQK